MSIVIYYIYQGEDNGAVKRHAISKDVIENENEEPEDFFNLGTADITNIRKIGEVVIAGETQYFDGDFTVVNDE